jgi:two-component system cell cycle response regulator
MALRVLLADESSTIKRVMQLALQDFGVEVKSVPVGLDVLPVTKTFKPDIIFADVLLAKKNGYEVCAELKADAETQSIPVILMWSGFMEIDDSKMTQAGPDARLEKPFDAEGLRQMVQDLVPKTQSNPVSAYLQFPKMPEFTEPAQAAPAASAPMGAPPTKSMPSARAQSIPVGADDGNAPKPQAKGIGIKIPTAAPIDFDKFDPTAEDDSIYGVPEEESFSNRTRAHMDLPMVESEDANPEESLLVAEDEEFASVPLKSEQQRDQLEDDGWQRQDLKKFKIQTPTASAQAAALDDDFAKKFVIPQDDVSSEVEGEFEELHFGDDLGGATRVDIPQKVSREVNREITQTLHSKIQTKTSPKITSAVAGGADSDMIERVIREEAREVIESICWKVIPEMAERIVREEISKILRDVEKST